MLRFGDVIFHLFGIIGAVVVGGGVVVGYTLTEAVVLRTDRPIIICPLLYLVQ